MVENGWSLVLFGGRLTRIYREMVFIGVLLPLVVGGIVNIGSLADFVYWGSTVLWLTGILLLFADWVLPRLQVVPVMDRRQA